MYITSGRSRSCLALFLCICYVMLDGSYLAYPQSGSTCGRASSFGQCWQGRAMCVEVLPGASFQESCRSARGATSSRRRALASSAGDAALDRRDSALRAENDRGSALMSITIPWSLSRFESRPSCQGSLLSASLAPCSWQRRGFQHLNPASNSQGCLMSLAALFLSHSC